MDGAVSDYERRGVVILRSRGDRGPLTVGSLFSGIGGFDLGFELAGFDVRWQVEIDTDAVARLERHWPTVQRFRDIIAVVYGRRRQRDAHGLVLPPEQGADPPRAR